MLSEDLDRARPLTEEVQQFEPLRCGDGLPEPRELLVDAVLEVPVGRHLTQVLKQLIECNRFRSGPSRLVTHAMRIGSRVTRSAARESPGYRRVISRFRRALNS